jgi:shikimate kinase/3-dehydroquinate synthase
MSRVQIDLPTIPRGRRNLLLTGFMAAGKTTVGKLVAERLKMPFFDLDSELEAWLGASIPQLLRTEGEPWFRQREAELMRQASHLSGSVIATGGGAPLSPAAFAELAATAVSLVLRADPEELARRASASGDRPLLADPDPNSVKGLLAEREAVYARAGDPVETTGLSPAEVASRVAEIYRLEAGTAALAIPVEGPDWRTELVVGAGAGSALPAVLQRLAPLSGRVFLLVDSGFGKAGVELLAAALCRQGLEVFSKEVPGGEAAKALASLEALWNWLLETGAERADVLVAVGGGAVLDAAGFAAATYARGIPHVNVPTTVLAMADAALGGKTAINLGRTKNPVGVFRHPIAVIADPSLLGSMSRPGARDGLAEVVKSAAIGSRLALSRMGRADFSGLGDATGGWLIEQALRIKAGYVAADPTERGPRAALNLGHTYAHGLESASDYAISHGSAVGLGLLASASLGVALGVTPAELQDSIRAALCRAGLPLTLPAGLDRSAVARAMRHDKKRRSGQIVFIVPGPGEGVVLVDDLELDWALEHLWSLADTRPGIPRAAAGGGEGR